MGVMEEWVAGFFIRNKQNPRVSSTNLLSALECGDSADDCPKLKTASLLREISDSLIRGNIAEETLDLLENLEKLQGSVVTESHKLAYCWTAVECTVQYMWPLSASEGLYTDAIERIWKKRVRVLKESGSGLVSVELLKWEDDLNKAVEDPDMYQRIRESNVRYTAACFLNQLLKEQWALLGCSSLESVAQRTLLKRKKPDDNNNNVLLKRKKPDDNNNNVEQEHEPILDKGGAAGEMKDYLLEILRQIEPSTRQVQEPITPQPSKVVNRAVPITPQPSKVVNRAVPITPQPSKVVNRAVPITPQPSKVVNRAGTSRQQQDNNASEEEDWSRVRPRLPTPVPLYVPLLNKAPRRPTRFWTPEEEAVLREGVNKYGRSWKSIKKANPEVLAQRTEVDLKDKWRNLEG